MSVQVVAAAEFMPTDPDVLAGIEAIVTPDLLSYGGLETIINRYKGDCRPWRIPSKEDARLADPGIILLPLLEPAAEYTGYPNELLRLFAARRTPATRRLGAKGLVTTIGFRPAGNRFNPVPIAAPEGLVWAANKYLA